LLPDGAGVVVGVSGGVDSIVLLHVLQQLAAPHGWRLVVAHLNHRLRGQAADADERFVASTAEKLGLRFESERADVKTFATAQRVSIEMAARRLRHEFLARIARRHSLEHICLAHHADDQVELFFLRLMRGSGAQGLGGMELSAPAPGDHALTVVRPLLGVWKSELIAWAAAHKLEFREDASNDSTDILRNRVRHHLLPSLRKDFQPQIDRAVLRSMDLVRDEGDFVTVEAIRWLRLPRAKPKFEELHVALQRRVVQVELLANGIVPQFEHVEKLRRNANEWLALGPALVVRRTDRGRIERRVIRSPKLQAGEMMCVLGDGPRSIDYDGLVVEAAEVGGPQRPRARPQTEFFDAGRVGARIVLRHWREGDRFQPIGLEHEAKLQDWFVNRKIPRERRHELVIATTAAGEIFWIEGERIGERFKVTPQTKTMLRWRWYR